MASIGVGGRRGAVVALRSGGRIAVGPRIVSVSTFTETPCVDVLPVVPECVPSETPHDELSRLGRGVVSFSAGWHVPRDIGQTAPIVGGLEQKGFRL